MVEPGGRQQREPAADEAAAMRSGEELDPAAVLRFLAEQREALGLLAAPSELDALQFHGGKANLTYRVRAGGRVLVLRRPPLGPVAAGAHDMSREYRVLSRLWRGYDRAPRALAFCDDPAVLGAPFFVMEHREGVVIRRSLPVAMRAHPDVERRVSFAMIDAMADLHRVDPRAVGLETLGRPEGFVQRQLAGWARRWSAARDRECPDFERLQGWLEDHQPASRGAALVHNDFKLDNCQFDPADPDRVTTVFDWDMATRGDPLVDIGTLLGYCREAHHGQVDREASAIFLMAEPGFPSRDELAERYAARSGLELADLGWYEAFALWKSAVVVQQIWIRYARGQTRDERFAGFGERVPEILALGLRVARGGAAAGDRGDGKRTEEERT